MNLEEITGSTVNSPADLMDLQESLNTPTNPEAGPPETIQRAFRGQPRSFGTLAPSFQREFGDRKSLPTAHLIESNLIDAFRRHYSNLTRSPGMPDSWEIGQGYNLLCLSVMQHYGVPTRLLDWTSNFWTAVYFACAGDPNEDAELWFYDRSIFQSQGSWLQGLENLRETSTNSTEPPKPEPEILSERGRNLVFELDPKLTPRMKTQMAHHTVSTEIFEDHAPLIFGLSQNLSDDPNRASDLHRIVIAKGCKEKALRFLDEHQDVTASTIFPDVEGLNRFLRWHLDSLLTTLL